MLLLTQQVPVRHSSCQPNTHHATSPTHSDEVMDGLWTGVRPVHIYNTSQLVSKYSGMIIQPNKSIVGANAFSHESGMHQDGMLKHRETYQIMTPETIGLQQKSADAGVCMCVCRGVWLWRWADAASNGQFGQCQDSACSTWCVVCSPTARGFDAVLMLTIVRTARGTSSTVTASHCLLLTHRTRRNS